MSRDEDTFLFSSYRIPLILRLHCTDAIFFLEVLGLISFNPLSILPLALFRGKIEE
jgi:hypothetical protein